MQKFADSFDELLAGIEPSAASSSTLDRSRHGARRADLGARPDRLDGARRGPLAGLARRAAADARARAELAAFAAGVAEEATTSCSRDGRLDLAPEVLRRDVRAASFHVLDTTHPTRSARSSALDLEQTFFLVASKSGTTLETRSHLEYFWERAASPARVRGDHRPGLELERSPGARLSHRLGRRADDRRTLLGALHVRPRAGGADGRRPGTAARPAREMT